MSQPCLCEAVGLKQMADRLGVRRQTAGAWQQRGLLPMPVWRVGKDPAWCWPHQIKPWATETGRWRKPE